MSVTVIHSLATLRAQLGLAKSSGKRIGAVPTMGALHEGHLSLVRAAKEKSDLVVVTIFVNPTQFGPGEDFDKYPRDLSRDAHLAEGAGADIVFAPSVDEMYPKGEQTRVKTGKISEGLCGAVRPGHFEGVCTIVTKLFHAIGDAEYFFGEKDYQQLKVIDQMARDLLFPVRVTGCPIVREPSGLAMSSRNAYLTEEQRKIAGEIPRALQKVLDAFNGGQRDVAMLRQLAWSHLSNVPLVIQYLEICDAVDLQLLGEETGRPQIDGPSVVLFAGYVGDTRLIDNVSLRYGAAPIVESRE